MQAAIILSVIFFSAYGLLILYYAANWRKIPVFFTTEVPDAITSVTVIIPARNEAANIGACLDALAAQTYPAQLFEILVIDDHSDDGTASVVKTYAATNTKLIALSDFTARDALNSYKKKAIEIGVQHSTGELIVTTDADCTMPPNWLQTIADFYQQSGAELIVMPVYFTRFSADGGLGKMLLVIFQQLDFMVLQGITGASVYKKVHSMCNGANLAYTRKSFIEVGGFTGIDKIASGDDMLLMHKIAARYPEKIKFLRSKDVIVQTAPMATLGSFFNQRIRWASKADKYDDKRITAVLALVYFFNLWLLILMVLAFFYLNAAVILLAALAAKTLLELLLLYPVARFFSASKVLIFFPFAQPFHILYTVIAGWLGKFGSYKWKGRKVN